MAVFERRSASGDRAAERMADILSPGQIDQMIRQAVQLCWMSLPRERRNAKEVEKQLRRLLDRALKDFREDCKAFGRAE